jgi:cytidylate kinase
MPIITISRGTYSGGMQLAECVAGRLDIPCVSREILVEAAEQFGVSEQALAEAMGRPPSFFERFSHQREIYLALVRTALLQHAAHGSFVYHGHAGHLLLSEIPNVIRVRVVAPMQFRVTAAMERLGVDQRAAVQHIEQVDRQREKWTRFLYGVEWEETSLYDMIVSLEHLDIDEVCEMLCGVARLKRFEWTEESRGAVADEALAALLTAELTRDPSTRGAELTVTARRGAVTIRGKAPGLSASAAIERIARGVPDVKEVTVEVAGASDVPG